MRLFVFYSYISIRRRCCNERAILNTLLGTYYITNHKLNIHIVYAQYMDFF